MPLTNTACLNAKSAAKPYRIADGQGLYLEVMPNGSKYWRLKYRFAGKEKRLALGVYPEVTVAQARDARDAARKQLADSVDPGAMKRAKKLKTALIAATTFELVAREWHEERKAYWSPGHANDVLHRLETDVFPRLGNRPITDLAASDVLACLRRIEDRGARELARRARQVCSQIFRYAVITDRAERNPAEHLQGALKPMRRGHFAAIEPNELPEFLEALAEHEGRLYAETRAALRLLLLMFVRTGELIGASWDEFDLDGGEWIIPAGRMKMRRPHIVPLSRQALIILRELHDLTGRWTWMFPNKARPHEHMSNGAILMALDRMGYRGRMTGHGFRALAMSTIKEKLGYRHEVVDRQLAHVPANKVDAAYDRAKFLDERRKMMQDWADYLDSLGRGATFGSQTSRHLPQSCETLADVQKSQITQ